MHERFLNVEKKRFFSLSIHISYIVVIEKKKKRERSRCFVNSVIMFADGGME